MTPEQRERVPELFEAALGQDSREREAFIKLACDDQEVQAEVRSLLAAHERVGSFLEDPALGPLSPELTKSTASPLVPIEIGRRYEILSEVGRGGMGIVYKAGDRETGEIVALKLLKPEIAADQTAIERFKNEMRLARKITHKNVCRIYEFHRVDYSAYISMEFVDGESLRHILNRFGGLPVRKGIQVARDLCAGLHEAHIQGTVHRDLKPENIMIDTSGSAKIMDFGIARSVETGLSHGTLVVGTPSYMAPEQAEGRNVDGRADIYALGLILYEVFTGTAAFTGDTPISIALKQISEMPVPLRQIDPSIPAYLEAIILRCLAKSPDERFQSVGELEGKLEESTELSDSSSNLPAPIRTSRFVIRSGIRHVLLISALLACIVTGFLLGRRQWERPSRMHHSDKVYEIAFSPDGKFLASASEDKTVTVWELATQKTVQRWLDSQPVVSAVFSPDGRWLALASGKTVKLWDWKADHYVLLAKHADSISSVAFSPDGHLVAAVGEETVKLWEVDTHKERLPGLFAHYGQKVMVVAFSPNGKWLASGDNDGKVKLWDLNTGQEKRFQVPLRQRDEIESLVFSPDSRWIASGGANKRIEIWEADTGDEFAELTGPKGFVTSLSFSPDSGYLAASDDVGSVTLWGLESRTLLSTFTDDGSSVETVAFSPDGRSVAWGTDKGNIEFRSVK